MAMDMRGEVIRIVEPIQCDATVGYSAFSDACRAHPNYPDLLALGQSAAPVLFAALAAYAVAEQGAETLVSPHIAITALTDLGFACEITPASRGRLKAMAGEWAARGRTLGLI